MNIPIDIWILIAGDDARLWNMLVRAIPGLHTQELVEKMKDKFEYRCDTNYYGEICGFRHTSLKYYHHKDRYGNAMDVMMNYGFLSGGEQQPALMVNTPSVRTNIYTTKGVLTRLNGPAVMVWSISKWLVVDVYLNDNDVTKINLFDFSDAYIARLTSLSPGKTADNLAITLYRNSFHDTIHQKYPQNSIEEIIESSPELYRVTDIYANTKEMVESLHDELIEAIDDVLDDSAPHLEYLPEGVLSFFKVQTTPRHNAGANYLAKNGVPM